ncbi:MAG: O-methyltransferase [Chitinophagales bacterium]
MNFFPEELQEYCEKHSSKEDEVLYELNRKTHLDVLKPRMLSGQHQGVFLQMLSHMIQPIQILEIGTYTGYSAICLAKGLKENGQLHTIDINEELKDLAAEYFQKAELEKKIKQYTGNALEIIPKIEAEFDLVFIDADKINYSNYYDLVLPKLRKGGFILADNVLWSGKVLEANSDKDTEALKAFNEKITKDPKVENVLVPIRDGVMVLRKI